LGDYGIGIGGAMNRYGVVRVFILDDHELIRMGVRECLAYEARIELVGEAATAELAVAMVPRLAVDVAVLDVRLPSGSGIEACREIRSACPQTECVMLTGHAEDEAMLAAIMAGAAGYVSKLAIVDELGEVVRAVAAGKSMLPPEATWRVMQRLNFLADADHEVALPVQDQQVLALIGEGMTNQEIAAELSLPEQAVRDSVSSLLALAGV